MALTSRAPKFDLARTQQFPSWQTMLEICQAADMLGFNAFFNGDHLMPVAGWDKFEGSPESWTMLAALAPVTKHLRLGVLVSGNTYRHPVMLARMAAMVDVASNGRVDFGIGAGWSREDHRAYGLPFPPFQERVDRLEEAVRVIKLLWTERIANFQGKYYTLTDAPFEPKPVQKPHPPIIIAGASDRTLRIAAKYADIWNAMGTPRFVIEKMKTLRQYLREAGRDPEEIEPSIHLDLVLTDDKAVVENIIKKRVAAMEKESKAGPFLSQAESSLESETSEEKARGPLLIGSPQEIRTQVERLVDAGMSRFVIRIPRRWDAPTMERFSQEVMAAFR